MAVLNMKPRGSNECSATLFLNLDAKWKWMVLFSPPRALPPDISLCPVLLQDCKTLVVKPLNCTAARRFPFHFLFAVNYCRLYILRTLILCLCLCFLIFSRPVFSGAPNPSILSSMHCTDPQFFLWCWSRCTVLSSTH